jgi:hypothetical protein
MFRFTIRDVLWLTAVVALGAAWRADRSRLERYVRKLKTDDQMRRALDSREVGIRSFER